tara:strand:- start:16382 stop:17683 length:1302 start_codon:yes stop_codon:yes gene_type:complete
MFKNFFNKNKSILIYGNSNFLILLSSLSISFFTLRYITPLEFGIYNKFLIVCNYFIILNLSLPVIIQSRLPGLLKLKKENDAENLLGSINLYYSFLVLISIIIFLFAFFFFLLDGLYFESICSILSIFLITNNLYFNKFIKLIYRSSNQIEYLSSKQKVVSFLGFFSSFLIIPFGIIGILVKQFLVFLHDYFYLKIRSPIKLKFLRKNLFTIMSDSFKVFRVNIFFMFFPLLVSSYSVFIFDEIIFGYFSIYFVLINSLNKLTVSMDKIFYIKISESFYKMKNVKHTLINLLKNNLFPLFTIYVLIILILFLFIDDIILLLFPNYVSSITIIKITLISSFLLFFNFLNIFYDVYNRLDIKFRSVLLKYFVFILINIFLYNLNIISTSSFLISIILAELSSIIYNFTVLFFLKYDRKIKSISNNTSKGWIKRDT